MYRSIIVSLLLISLWSCKENTKEKELPVKVIPEFTPSQLAIIQGDTTEPYNVLKITNQEDSILLRKESEKVRFTNGDSILNIFEKRLVATLKDSSSLGVGIAAPQVGILKNIICVQRFDKDAEPFEVYYNPTIKQYSKKTQPCREGCLSIPGRMDTLTVRSYAILLEYDDLQGVHQYEMVEDFTAVIFQHEIDHLKGILYTDYLHEKAHAEGIKHKHPNK
ncbi:MAG: peptide deformylase [Flavobacteriales bacterium]|jgi:peptide deformylase|nr:peptide deformylase [Flavobacteriales bacterium]